MSFNDARGGQRSSNASIKKQQQINQLSCFSANTVYFERTPGFPPAGDSEDSVHRPNSDNLMCLLSSEGGTFVSVDGNRHGAYRCCPNSQNHVRRLQWRPNVLLRVLVLKTTERDPERALVDQFTRTAPPPGQ